MPANVVLAVGTRKGLFIMKSDLKRGQWQLLGPFLNGDDINHATFDARDERLYATANGPWFGNQVRFSSDLGQTWQQSPVAPKFPEGSGKSVERLWRIEPGRASEPGVLFCGVDPGSLFRSNDGAEHWLEDEGLNTHPTRDRWSPGAGGLITHSVVLDPANTSRMWVGISAAGVFGTNDGGVSWQPLNAGLKNILAKYDPSA